MKTKILKIIGIIIAGHIIYRIFLCCNPGLAYEWITGNKLPEGVEAVSYSRRVNDNFFHMGHYWEFVHSKKGMGLLLKQIGADEESYDAIGVLYAIEMALDKKIPVTSIGRGYEISKQNCRDSWLLIDNNGDRSFYELN